MDAKPKSNKIKRLERRRKREERADRRSRAHAQKAAAARIILADQALKGSDSPWRGTRHFQNDDFWMSVIRWFIANPMLDAVHHGPITDYLHDQRFVASVPNPLAHLPGQPGRLAPQPNLTMKGRNPEAVLRAVAEWHRRIGRPRSDKPVSWAPSGLSPYRFEEGEGHNLKVYSITELLSSRELEDEGQAMSHCVATYAGSCAAGHVSICAQGRRFVSS